MRQVMPHRNNIVPDLRRCKCFLRPVDDRLPNSGALWHSCLNAPLAQKKKI